MANTILSNPYLNLKSSYLKEPPRSDSSSAETDWLEFMAFWLKGGFLPFFGIERDWIENNTLRQLDTLATEDEQRWIDQQVESVLKAIRLIRERLEEQKEHWSPFIAQEDSPAIPPSYQLYPNENGCGGSYFILDETGAPKYVVKAVDEDIFCLNNRKGYVSCETGELVRQGIPVYRSAQIDCLAYETALLLGVGHITPKAWMGILSNPTFYDITDAMSHEQYEEFVERTAAPSKEKLCSIQEFLEGAKDLGEVYFDYESLGKPFILDPEDFEDLHLLLWTTFDTDAHLFNLMVYEKGIDAEGNSIWGLKKVDNSLCYPNVNVGFRNVLQYFPQSQQPLSDALRQKIANIPTAEIIERIKKYEMQDVIPAFESRITFLQENISNFSTIAEVNQALLLMNKETTYDVTMENSESRLYADYGNTSR